MICWCCSWISRSILSRLGATTLWQKQYGWCVRPCVRQRHSDGTPSFYNNTTAIRCRVGIITQDPGRSGDGVFLEMAIDSLASNSQFVDVGDVGDVESRNTREVPRPNTPPVRLYLTIFHRDECFPSKKATSRHIGSQLQLSPREGFGLNTICLPFAH